MTRGENLYGKGQRVLSKAGWENWDRIFGKKKCDCGGKCGDDCKCKGDK